MGFLRLLYMPIMLFKTVAKTIGIIKEFKPDITIGMGGYVSAPVGVASLLTGVPLYIHEQNSIPGLTNKLLSRFAQRTLTAFPSAFRGRKRVTLVGNPVRKEILFADYNARLVGSHGGPVKVLVLGGSRGATALNNKLPEVLSRVNEQLQITVWHQCGRGKSQSVQQIYNSRSVENNVVEFIEKIEEAYAWADFVICRSGALTIAELCVVGLGSMLIPYPFAVDDHQTRNAELLAHNNAAIIENESNIDARLTSEKLIDILGSRSALHDMAQNALRLASGAATQDIVKICLGHEQEAGVRS